jgi:hypothetical protein
MNFVDPVEAPGIIAGSRRGNGFGPDITAAFLQKTNLSWLLRSHEWCRRGHKPTHNNTCFTVFRRPITGTDIETSARWRISRSSRLEQMPRSRTGQFRNLTVALTLGMNSRSRQRHLRGQS